MKPILNTGMGLWITEKALSIAVQIKWLKVAKTNSRQAIEQTYSIAMLRFGTSCICVSYIMETLFPYVYYVTD